jgi:hypothetical protein
LGGDPVVSELCYFVPPIRALLLCQNVSDSHSELVSVSMYHAGRVDVAKTFCDIAHSSDGEIAG